MMKVLTILKTVVTRIFFVACGLALALLVMEGILRVYNPFQFRVRGSHIVLPVNKRSVIQNEKVAKLDKTIVHTTNSLGFRGEEPPGGIPKGKYLPLVFDQYLTILAVGGSTTECYFLSDGNTWPEVLGDLLKQKIEKVWVNNAGFVGHSTFGHLRLLQDTIVPLHPDVVLFLTGLNDIGITDLNQTFDAQIMEGGKFTRTDDAQAASSLCWKSPACLFVSLADYSEVVNLGLNLYRNARAATALPGRANPSAVVTGDIDDIQEDLPSYSHLTVPNADDILAGITLEKDSTLRGYAERLRQIIQLCRQNDIEPVFVTQPVLYGQGVDDVTGVDLETIEINPHTNGYLQWNVLEKYNDVVRQAGRDERVLVIDLAEKMPHSSTYYYDFVHYTNAGARKVAEIIFADLYPFLESRSW